MATIKSYTDIEQSKKLAKILPIESADMVLPFRHTKNDEYIPGYVASRNYVEVYNEMMKLPGMGKEDVCQLIQPAWSLAALLDVLPDDCGIDKEDGKYVGYAVSDECGTYTSDNPVDACVSMIEYLHELKESEDEKIRKEIIEIFKSAQRDGICEPIKNEQFEKIFAWLEKQGKKIDVIENFDTEFEKQVSHLIASAINKEHEYNDGFVKWTANALLNYAKHELEKQGKQKPIDKIEPKFKVGDTIVEKDLDECGCGTIVNIKDGKYIFDDGCFIRIKEQEGWKLVKTPTIIEQKNIEGTFINVDEVRENFVKEVYRVLANDTTNDRANDIIYYFDSLPTIYLHTNKPLAPDGDDFDMDDILKNHAWSEEDDKILNEFIESLRYSNGNGYNKQIDWLKSLKDRIQPQLKQEWSDEDYNEIETIACHLDNIDNEDIADVLRSIRDKYCHIIPQSTWKPSDEQMKFLWKYAEQNNYDGTILTSLFHDLKKLREE